MGTLWQKVESWLIMELVDGETLRGPLPIETTLNYAGQIAKALEAAHEKKGSCTAT